ncbi:preprotein translocase subunit SecE [Candidatus Wolfebacteria bacterium RIFCSPLOWO2_01_FULL_45_19]|uniref:Protein translocase subunit SecE n=1 Tax=Candidatus Wolfebacteria bacterium RIFCSPLOWO2_01_FULL_45_19 TaxID=1802557 RepID=A0A1F8DT17_9BACT|nr:MAG: preprotein translocase subunit SecE [Candidatus Wolfebacteria bacterium RIFCSPLOWO2_01_FULL_45_19]
MEKSKTFVKEARQELKRVNWPNRRETMRLTMIVIIMSLVTAAFLGFIDYLLTSAIKTIL